MSWPKELSRGQVITAEWLNSLLRESKRNEIVSSPGTRVARLSQTTVTPIYNPAGHNDGVPKSKTPWLVFQWTPDSPDEGECQYTYWRNVRVHLGYVNGENKEIANPVKCHELDGALPTGAAAGSDYDILIPAGATEYKIWGKVKFTRGPATSAAEPTVDLTSLEIQHGADWWAEHPAQYPEVSGDEKEYYFEIATADTTDDQLPYDDCPEEEEPNESYPPVLTLNQIAYSDQFIASIWVIGVNLSATGGDAGDIETDCSFTYTVTDYSDPPITLLSSASPVNERTAKCGYSEGTIGLAWINESGDFVFVALDEAVVGKTVDVGTGELQISDGNLQTGTRKMTVLDSGEETTWTDVIAVEECEE